MVGRQNLECKNSRNSQETTEAGSSMEIFEAKALEMCMPGSKSGIHKGILLRENMEKRNCSVL